MSPTSLAIPTALCLAAAGLGALAAPAGLAETVLEHGIKVRVEGKMRPAALPRRGTAPIGVRIGGKISLDEPGELPKLTKLTIALNRHGHLDARGLPRCRIGQIRPSTTREARATCGKALVGEGSFTANVKLPTQTPFPSNGKVLAFNGVTHGRPAILAQIYGTEPLPTSYVLPFEIGHAKKKSPYGTVLEAEFPEVTGEWGYVTGISMSLHRRFTYHGKTHGYLSAGCPAPSETDIAPFQLAQTQFAFDNEVTITTTLNRACRVRG